MNTARSPARRLKGVCLPDASKHSKGLLVWRFEAPQTIRPREVSLTLPHIDNWETADSTTTLYNGDLAGREAAAHPEAQAVRSIIASAQGVGERGSSAPGGTGAGRSGRRDPRHRGTLRSQDVTCPRVRTLFAISVPLAAPSHCVVQFRALKFDTTSIRKGGPQYKSRRAESLSVWEKKKRKPVGKYGITTWRKLHS